MTISVIIPALDEANNVATLVQHLLKNKNDTLLEVIVVDGGSTDDTVALATNAGASVVAASRCGRASQMNEGAFVANGEILYFVHCDTLPPATYLSDIQKAIKEGNALGCFQACFNSKRLLVRLNGFFSRFDRLWCRGGDQTLFVTKEAFWKMEGYKEELQIMEEYDFLIRARKKYAFKIIPNRVLISARKYENRSFFKVQFANLIVFNMFRLGYPQERLVRTYKQLLN